MLKTQDFVDFLSEKMNAVKDSVQFNIVAELGEHKNDGKFQGIVRRVDAPFEKVGDMVAANYRFVVELSVPTGRSNKNVLKISEIVDSVVESYHRTRQAMGSGSGELFFQLTSTEDFEIKAGVGAGVGLAFGVKVFYTENAVSKGNEVWKLDDAIIPFKTRTLSMVREGATFEVPNKDFSEALFKKQTRTYSFELDYNEESLVCSSLAKALFENSFDKVYTLKFYDGKTFTEASPFEAKVSLSSNSESRADDMTPTALRVVFSDVPVSTVFEIGLCDFDFDIGSEDTLYFDSQKQQQAFFDNEMVGEYVDLMSESLSSIFSTSQIYRINSLEITPQEAIGWANKNYAVIRVTSGGEKFYYYYYVLKSGVGAKNQIVVDLQLDEIQTFFFNENVKFKDAFIKKAHINRFVENGDRTVSFDGGVDSPLFVREDFQGVAKRMISRTRLALCPSRNKDSVINEWIKENVAGWVYFYLTYRESGYDVKNNTSNSNTNVKAILLPVRFQQHNLPGSTSIYGVCPVICFPIYRGSKFIKLFRTGGDRGVFNKTNFIVMSGMAMESFRKINNNNSYVLSVKLSCVPPFKIDEGREQEVDTGTGQNRYSIDSNGNLCFHRDTGFSIHYEYGNSYVSGVRVDNYEYATNSDGMGAFTTTLSPTFNYTDTYIISKPFTFSKLEIMLSKKDVRFNPKLLSSDFYSLKLTNERGSGFEYDVQKLNKSILEFKYTEALTPDITRSYFRVSNADGVYISETSQNLTGFVDNADMSMMVDNDKLSQMLAENKNYYLQNVLNVGTGILTGAVGGSFIGKNAGGAIAGAAVGLIGSVVNNALTVDNMKNSPNDVKNSNGNTMFNVSYSEISPFVEEYDILPHEKEIVNEQMFRYGFNYNKNGDIKDFVNTRKYFNFVQATIGTIQTSGVSLSNEIRTKFRERFERGVRFWHYSDGKAVSYENENYERWLEENSVELEYVVSGGSINIGLAGRNGGLGTTGLAYKWAVYLNDEYVGDYEGVTANNHKITIPTSVSGLNKVNLVCLLENQDYCARSIAFSGGGFDIDSTGLIKVTGYGTAYTGAGAMPKACFAEAFSGCIDLITPPDLPSMNVGEYGYFGMFSRCPNLLYAQDLPATDLSPHCYSNMYRFSENLITSMEVLPAENVPAYAYQSMFGGTAVKIAPRLPAMILGNGCYSAMFSGSALEVAPELPATELASSCYASMFNDCTLLTEVICHFFDEEGLGMFYNLYAPNWLGGIYTVGKLYSPFANIDEGLPVNWTAEEI